MTILEQSTGDGRTYLGGWSRLASTTDIVLPSTGERIGSYAQGTVADIEGAADLAVGAQKQWSTASPDERSAILRRAGVLIEENQGLLAHWLQEEAGSAQGKAGFEAGLVAAECHHAFATAMVAYGHLLRTGRPRLSMARRVPTGGSREQSADAARPTQRSPSSHRTTCGIPPRASRSAPART